MAHDRSSMQGRFPASMSLLRLTASWLNSVWQEGKTRSTRDDFEEGSAYGLSEFERS
jgi:hypothetical protein